MRKHLREESTLDFNVPKSHDGGAAGCTWNIFHVFRYHHWRHISTRLPHKRRHSGSKSPAGDENPGTYSVLEQKKMEDNHIGGKLSKNPPNQPAATKNSVRARLIARMTNEFCKRKGRHHRSSTFPARAQLIRSESFHRLKLPDNIMETRSDDLSPNVLDHRKRRFWATSSSDAVVLKSPKKPTTSGKNSDECKDHKNGKQQVPGGMICNELYCTMPTSSENKSSHAKELPRHPSLDQSKELFEALGLINVNKELNNVTQDPNCEKEFSAKMGLTKSESFPLCNSFDPGLDKCKLEQQVDSHSQQSHGHESTEDIYKQSTPSIAAKHREDGLKINESIIDHSSSGSPKSLKNYHVNRMVIKGFKDLKEKIKQVIKMEKWITRDAILDKIPRRHGFSKDLNEDVFDHMRVNRDGPKSSNVRDQFSSTYQKKRHNFKRTSSLDESSLDRYCQLYDLSFIKKDSKENISEKSNSRINHKEALPSASGPKYLGRILSSPELGFFSHTNEDSSEIACSDKKKRIENPLAIESKPQLYYTEETDVQENVEPYTNANSNTDYLVNLTLGDFSIVELQQDIGNLSKSATELIKSNPLSVDDYDLRDDAVAAEFYLSEDDESAQNHLPNELFSLENLQHQLTEDTVGEDEYELNLEKVEIPRKCIHIDILRDQVDTKDRAKFDYVREVLEYAGFSGTVSLGAWHSDDHPLDVAMYQEIESSVLLDPNCLVNEKNVNCIHLVLFDVINEVLIDLWESSYAYFPKPLSSLSYIRPMPLGYHVVEEVWAHINWYLNSIPNPDQSLDYVVSRDLSKNDGWMNLQFDMECVGFELEDLIFENLLEEVIRT